MDQKEIIDRCAERIISAAESGTACAPIRELIGDTDVDSAYQVQQRINLKHTRNGRKVVGAKIGLTSKAVQKQLGVDQPDYGLLFEDMMIPDGGSVPWNELMQPKGEVEIAFLLAKALDGTEFTEEEIRDAIESAVIAIEIAGSRIAGWDIRITDTIADNASASHFVLGSEKVPLDQVDPIGCIMEMKKNGEMVSQGTGEACLGSPLNAVCWLAVTMAKRGHPLKKGDVVLSGALGPMTDLAPGDHIEASITGLGTISLNIGNQVMNNSKEAFAQALHQAAQHASAIPQISKNQAITLEDAYDIQKKLIDLRFEQGEKYTGLKMGFTSIAKMEQMGVNDMIWGRLTDAMELQNSDVLRFGNFIHPRVEPEIAFRISKDIDKEIPLEEIKDICNGVAPALEVIDSRYADFRFSLEDVIADNCSGAAYVIGEWKDPDQDISNIKLSLKINNEVIHSGSSNAILGDPWKSLQAVTRLAAQYGQIIPSGSVILAGAATPAEHLSPGQHISVEVEILGNVGFTVG